MTFPLMSWEPRKVFTSRAEHDGPKLMKIENITIIIYAHAHTNLYNAKINSSTRNQFELAREEITNCDGCLHYYSSNSLFRRTSFSYPTSPPGHNPDITEDLSDKKDFFAQSLSDIFFNFHTPLK